MEDLNFGRTLPSNMTEYLKRELLDYWRRDVCFRECIVHIPSRTLDGMVPAIKTACWPPNAARWQKWWINLHLFRGDFYTGDTTYCKPWLLDTQFFALSEAMVPDVCWCMYSSAHNARQFIHYDTFLMVVVRVRPGTPGICEITIFHV